MKKSFIAIVLLFLCACTAMPTTTQPAATEPAAPRVRSPEISADRHVTFRLRAPKATEVLLTGEFMKGSKPFTKSNDGMWSITVGPIDPEIYTYNVTIDGVRTIDPNNPHVKIGSTPSTIASLLEVPGDSPAFYDGQPVPHGDIHVLSYDSKSLGTLRRANVYTPPGYDRDTQNRYPVVYLLHGANADETAWQQLGKANLILDNLIAAGKIKPFIAVMPFGYGVLPGTTPQPTDDKNTESKNTEKFSTDLRTDLIPLIDAKYRTLADRDHRALVGLSMGGGEAMSIGLNHLELFSYVGGFSSGLAKVDDFPKAYGTFASDPTAANQKLHLLWIGCGKDDGHIKTNLAFSEYLTKNGIHHTFRQTDGAHTWIVWRRY